MFAKRRKAHEKEYRGERLRKLSEIDSTLGKMREIMGKEEDNVSHVTELHVLHC